VAIALSQPQQKSRAKGKFEKDFDQRGWPGLSMLAYELAHVTNLILIAMAIVCSNFLLIDVSE